MTKTKALATYSIATGAAVSALFALSAVTAQPSEAPATYPVGDSSTFTRTLRSPTPEDLGKLGFPTGVYRGSPKVLASKQQYEDAFYATLASKKVWNEGTSPETHERGGPITWTIAPIPQAAPPPCSEPQPTKYDAESCRIVGALYHDVEKTDPAKAEALREAVRRGRDVWFKGSFGNQDLNDIHLARTVGYDRMHYTNWIHTKHRPYRYTKWGMINDPDCTQGDESTYWLDDCVDPKSTGVVGYRKYFRDPTVSDAGEITYDPRTAPYEDGEMESQKRFMIAHTCVQCHVAFDPTDPPADPNEPEWRNLMGLIGNQYVNQPHAAFLSAVPEDDFAWQALNAARPGTVDTSLNPNDFMHNPGTQNNITDFINRPMFTHEMKHPITGEISEATTQHILKGGEDSVGDKLALLRVYINIGMCTEECWVPIFPVPGDFFGEGRTQTPMRVKQCAADCEAWNHADAKMDDLAAYILSGGPTYLMAATDVDGKKGEEFIDLDKVPAGRTVYARNCASCHSTKVPPDTIASDPDALEKFYEGHVFGAEPYWQYEFTEAERSSDAFKAKHLVEVDGQWRPRQFAEDGVFGQDWLGNDRLTPFNVVGTNSCRARHDNHSTGHIWEDFASETYRAKASPGSVPKKLNRMVPLIGGAEVGTQEIGGPANGSEFTDDGAGYYRNISLLNVWAIAPFLHNNAVGELTYLDDGGIDYTVAGRIAQYEIAMERLLMSDDPTVEPHRPQKISVTTTDIKVAPREDGKGFIKLPVAEGTPVAYFASSDPHKPIFQKCDDLVENKGHQFGVDLSAADKEALTEFLKLM